MRRQYWIYIMASETRCLYTGVTSDLVRRVWEHRTGAHAGFTRRYRITRLVHFESTSDVPTALRREKQIKSWSRSKRVALIERANAGWLDLAADWFAR